jgi:hypothetical protein
MLCIASLFASIGKIVVLKGDVKIQRDKKVIQAKNGIEVFNKDKITTAKKSKAQIIFKDETVIRLGTNTNFSIQEYLYDKTKNSKAKFKVNKGFFNTITGGIGKVARKNFKLQTRTATCGIRGTNFSGLITPTEENIACTRGGIDVTANGLSVNVNAGEITSFASGLPPQAPREIKAGELQQLEKGSDALEEDTAPEAQTSDEGESEEDGDNQDTTNDEGDQEEQTEDNADNNEATPAEDNTDGDNQDGDTQQPNDTVEDEADNNTPVATQTTTETATQQPNEDIALGDIDEIEVEVDIEQVRVDTESTIEINEIDTTELVVDINDITNDEAIADIVEEVNIIEDTTTTTPTTTMDTFMGGAEATEFWMKGSGTRTSLVYTGTLTGTEINDNGSYDISSNNLILYVDMGNRILYGQTIFTSADETTENIVLLGNNATSITNSGFSIPSNGIFELGTTSIYHIEDGTALVSNGLFLGDSASAISADMTFDSAEGYDYTDFDAVINGTLISRIELTAQSVKTDSVFDWGFWAAGTLGDLSDTSLTSANAMGVWIEPVSGVGFIDSATLAEYQTNSQSATYKGILLGNTISQDGVNYIRNGNFTLNLMFGTNTLEGSMNFVAYSNVISQDRYWSLAINSGTIDGNSFIFDDITSDTYSEVTVDSFYGSGEIFLSDGDAIAGGVKLTSTDGEMAIAAMKAYTSTNTDYTKTLFGENTTSDTFAYDTDQATFPSWTTLGGNRVVSTYSGSFGGQATSTSASGNVGSDSLGVIIDFANKLVLGTTTYERVDDVTETLYFAQVGKNGVTSYNTVLYADSFYKETSTSGVYTSASFDSAVAQLSYFGQEAEILAGSIQYTSSSDSMIADIVAELVENITLSPKLYNQDSYFEWGYWTKDDIGSKTDSEILASVVYGAWIDPSNIPATDPSVINGYIAAATSTTLTYSSSDLLIGTIHTGTNTELIQNGSVDMTFVLGNNTSSISGTMAFEGTNSSWNANIAGSNTVSGNTFSFGNGSGSEYVNTTTNAVSNINYVEGAGQFYGTAADAVSGGFRMTTDSGNVAVGAFKAMK